MSGKTLKEDMSTSDFMEFTTKMNDVAKPGKRISDKVRAVFSGFKAPK